MCVDWQVERCRPGTVTGQGGLFIDPGPALARSSEVLASARQAGMPIVHTREGQAADLCDCPPNKLWRSRRAMPANGGQKHVGGLVVRGTPAWEIVPEMAPRPGEWVIDKPGKGGFFATELDLVLRSHGVTHLVFTGSSAEVSVHTTMREATDRGYECLLLADCTLSHDEQSYVAALEMVRMHGGMFGAVSSCQEFCTALKG